MPTLTQTLTRTRLHAISYPYMIIPTYPGLLEAEEESFAATGVAAGDSADGVPDA